LAESANSRVGLYRLFTKIWGSLAVNGKPIRNGGELVERVTSTPIGDTLTVTVLREGKHTTRDLGGQGSTGEMTDAISQAPEK
ncbi:MAG: hypothetical protein ABSA97_00855, partial [Verrucomicrobiia bacterium]